MIQVQSYFYFFPVFPMYVNLDVETEKIKNKNNTN